MRHARMLLVVNAWLVRAGKSGENDDFCLSSSLSVINWTDIADLSPYEDWTEFKSFVRSAYPDLKDGAVTTYAAQLYAFAHRIQIGDLIILPLKTVRQIAIGQVTGPYHYEAAAQPSLRHRRSVSWKVTDLPRTAVKQDLLYTLGAFMTVCNVSRHDAVKRLQSLMDTGVDPGSDDANAVIPGPTGSDEGEEAPFDFVDVATTAITATIAEEFAGHGLAHLVAAILRAEGFYCDISPEGPDGGVDILAGFGPFGLQSPRLVVQVKSGSGQIGAPVVRELHGVIKTHNGDQGLLVAWGGINRDARTELANQRFNLRVWDAQNIVDLVCQHYPSFPQEIRDRLPLRQLWVVDQKLK